MKQLDLKEEISTIEIEHCSVLTEHLGRILAEGYKDPEMIEIARQMDPIKMRDRFRELFTDSDFLKLFKTDMGKAMLIGTYFQRFVLGDRDAG